MNIKFIVGYLMLVISTNCFAMYDPDACLETRVIYYLLQLCDTQNPGELEAPLDEKITDKKNDRRPLHYAAIYNAYFCVDRLLEIGAKPTVTDSKKVTPLHIAADRNFECIAKKFLQKGALVNAQTLKKETPLHWAARKGNVELVRLLLAHHADMYITNIDGKRATDVTNNPIIKTLLAIPKPKSASKRGRQNVHS